MVAMSIHVLACGTHGTPAAADCNTASSQGVLMLPIKSVLVDQTVLRVAIRREIYAISSWRSPRGGRKTRSGVPRKVWNCDCGHIHSPFRALTNAEEKELVSLVNETSPDVFWVGLGSPN